MEPTASQKKAFGEALREARKKAKLSGRDLAAELNTSHQKIYQWENGQGAPETRDGLDRLEGALGTNGALAALLLGDDGLAQRIAELERRAEATESLIEEVLRRLEGR